LKLTILDFNCRDESRDTREGVLSIIYYRNRYNPFAVYPKIASLSIDIKTYTLELSKPLHVY